uniref:Large ribosomal subunit protein uL4c n=1 Tax=Hommersandiophycus borowitzkae TaxID=268573 RepID=A0A1G4NU30_9FLOR|nr:Ribosomal protein L4 [Hommersandiophycus borowitzkae]SCW22203.1 Ribosomal protein L4 [Hommersandiophycus borowitzkae]
MTIEKTISYNLYQANQKTDNCTTINLNISSQNTDRFIVHRSLIKQNAEKRQGTASTKTRSEVRGGGRKPWKQKGTGKARAGSIRSPLWRGGGVIFGPKPKTYKLKLNSKEKQLALRNLLYNKTACTILINENEVNFEIPQTKIVVKKLNDLGIIDKQHTLFIVKNKSTNLYLSSRNLPYLELIQANHLNIRSLLRAKKIIITEQALSIINEVYNATR